MGWCSDPAHLVKAVKVLVWTIAVVDWIFIKSIAGKHLPALKFQPTHVCAGFHVLNSIIETCFSGIKCCREDNA